MASKIKFPDEPDYEAIQAPWSMVGSIIGARSPMVGSMIAAKGSEDAQAAAEEYQKAYQKAVQAAQKEAQKAAQKMAQRAASQRRQPSFDPWMSEGYMPDDAPPDYTGDAGFREIARNPWPQQREQPRSRYGDGWLGVDPPPAAPEPGREYTPSSSMSPPRMGEDLGTIATRVTDTTHSLIENLINPPTTQPAVPRNTGAAPQNYPTNIPYADPNTSNQRPGQRIDSPWMATPARPQVQTDYWKGPQNPTTPLLDAIRRRDPKANPTEAAARFAAGQDDQGVGYEVARVAWAKEKGLDYRDPKVLAQAPVDYLESWLGMWRANQAGAPDTDWASRELQGIGMRTPQGKMTDALDQIVNRGMANAQPTVNASPVEQPIPTINPQTGEPTVEPVRPRTTPRPAPTINPQTGEPGVASVKPGQRLNIVDQGEKTSYWTSGGTHAGNPAADIFAPKGTPIKAPVSGTVEVLNVKYGGNAAILKGDDGLYYYMAHGNVPFKGGRVEAGQPIGEVGNSGNAAQTAPHVHYAIASDPAVFDRTNGSGDVAGDEFDWTPRPVKVAAGAPQPVAPAPAPVAPAPTPGSRGQAQIQPLSYNAAAPAEVSNGGAPLPQRMDTSSL